MVTMLANNGIPNINAANTAGRIGNIRRTLGWKTGRNEMATIISHMTIAPGLCMEKKFPTMGLLTMLDMAVNR